ncbi:MAG: hypothetical protein MI861_12750, partial [Pirellulales bacterium]|nr:hypothetical protein [Pirellulales bacterium]
MPCLRHPRHRQGGFLIEAVIATALLATALLGLAKLARTSALLQRQADQRLAASLAAENVLEKLKPMPVDTLVAQAGGVARRVEESSNCEVQLTVDSMQISGRRAAHLTVKAAASEHTQVTLHHWVIDRIDLA